MSENHLRELINRIADALESDEDFDVDEALRVIEQTKTSLHRTFQRYQKACPPEAKDASECLTASVTLFFGALTNLETYTDTCEDALLKQARTEAEQAGVLLDEALDWAHSVTERHKQQGLY